MHEAELGHQEAELQKVRYMLLICDEGMPLPGEGMFQASSKTTILKNDDIQEKWNRLES